MTQIKPCVGVLALQGAFQIHKPHVEALGATYHEVINVRDLEVIDALILPGGESSVMLKLLTLLELKTPLQNFLKTKPAWGICAGGILMARAVHNPSQESLNVMDMEVERNSYGRQLSSMTQVIHNHKVSYIRAPKILQVGPHVQVLSEREGSPTWVECQNLMVTTFHPEIHSTYPSFWHQRLVERIISSQK
jgi:5'-phosphate synthase pdxT subunit